MSHFDDRIRRDKEKMVNSCCMNGDSEFTRVVLLSALSRYRQNG